MSSRGRTRRREAQPARPRSRARRLAEPRPPRADAARVRGAAHRSAAARLLRLPGHRSGGRRGLRRPARARAPRRRARDPPGSTTRQLAGFGALLEATAAAISHEQWDAANAAFHEYQIDLAGNALLSRFYRELSVNLMMQVIRGGHVEGHANLVTEHRRIVEAFEAGDIRAARQRDPRAHRDRPPDRARRDRARRRRPLATRPLARRAGLRTVRSAHGERRGPPADRLRHRGQAGLHGRRRAARAARAPGRVPLHARPVPDDVPRPPVDDPPVRGLRLGRGDERAVPLPARARPDGALGRLRPADAARLRLGRPARRRARSAGRASRSTRSPTWRCCSTASRSARSRRR